MARSRPKQQGKKPARRAPAARRRRGGARALGAGGELALAAFAHDIRTALTGILSLGELLASSNLGERERRWAAGVKNAAEHLAALTALAVDSAKAENGSLTLQREVFRPLRLVEALGESLAVRAQTKGLQSEVILADDLPPLLVGDPVRLRAALENLIDNAVKFTERGVIHLDARTARAARGRVKLILSVTDSGIGLTPAEIKRLFRPFTQASDEIARRYGGAGLGLAVVKLLAKLMDGDLTVTSTPGSGSCFSFSAVLPIGAGAAATGDREREMSPPPRPLSVLCAEDNPYGRVILNTILTELGHRADFVGSGEEAIAAVARGYDVLLMDVTLPGIDGLETARRIRAFEGSAGRTPIVGISGRSETGDEAAARVAGMDFYLRKPISPSALNDAIAAVVPHSPDAI